VDLATPPVINQEHLDANHKDDMHLHYRTMENLLGPVSPCGMVSWILEHELNVVSSDEPNSFEEAEADPS
jgi:hypothetical protein